LHVIRTNYGMNINFIFSQIVWSLPRNAFWKDEVHRMCNYDRCDPVFDDGGNNRTT
jgi:hypothetical protein